MLDAELTCLITGSWANDLRNWYNGILHAYIEQWQTQYITEYYSLALNHQHDVCSVNGPGKWGAWLRPRDGHEGVIVMRNSDYFEGIRRPYIRRLDRVTHSVARLADSPSHSSKSRPWFAPEPVVRPINPSSIMCRTIDLGMNANGHINLQASLRFCMISRSSSSDLWEHISRFTTFMIHMHIPLKYYLIQSWKFITFLIKVFNHKNTKCLTQL